MRSGAAPSFEQAQKDIPETRKKKKTRKKPGQGEEKNDCLTSINEVRIKPAAKNLKRVRILHRRSEPEEVVFENPDGKE